jgi:peptide/nickel transport system ATP-binding protein
VTPLLEVAGLRVAFASDGGVMRAVDGVSFTLGAGEVLAIVGESGAGKSVTVMTLVGLTRGPRSVSTGPLASSGASC